MKRNINRIFSLSLSMIMLPLCFAQDAIAQNVRVIIPRMTNLHFGTATGVIDGGRKKRPLHSNYFRAG
jgi:hypothetical protein